MATRESPYHRLCEERKQELESDRIIVNTRHENGVVVVCRERFCDVIYKYEL